MNRIITIFFFLTFLISSSTFSQEITIRVVGTTEKAVLFELEGEKANQIDSVFLQNGKFKFSLVKNHNGFYRLQFDIKHWIDFINDGKDVE